MASSSSAGHAKSGKANFDDIYDKQDPRDYFNTLGSMGYAAPWHGYRLFSALRQSMSSEGRFTIMDVCCSYGINGALLKYDVTLDDLYARYGSNELAGMSSEELAESDREFYGERERRDAPRVIGLDVAANAIAYGVSAGMLDEGLAENLEDHEPSRKLRGLVSEVDLITVTGGVGYITGSTFERLLDSLPEGKKPWIAVLALRWVDFEPLSELLSRYGYVTERLEGHTFEQRRFADDAEQEYVCEELSKMGVDPEGKEREGSYHAHFHLARPSDEARSSVEELVASALS
ncbi:MAG: hypothetical protein L0G70_06615 [Rubrobacter sp.]|nr:hypothetical protein [Rubrobacter sp.]